MFLHVLRSNCFWKCALCSLYFDHISFASTAHFLHYIAEVSVDPERIPFFVPIFNAVFWLLLGVASIRLAGPMFEVYGGEGVDVF